MSKTMIRQCAAIAFGAYLTLFHLPAMSAWWLVFGHINVSERKPIGDEAFRFQLGDISCEATKVEFNRGPGNSLIEMRNLVCQTDRSTRVGIVLGC